MRVCEYCSTWIVFASEEFCNTCGRKVKEK